MTITDNNGYPISPIIVKPVNEHDCTILPEAFTELITFTKRIGLDLSGSALTLDSGFDTKANHKIIKEQGLLPVIYPNRRNAKEPIVIARKFRKLVLSYDKLKETRLGFRHLAYSMINFRVAFNDT